MKIKINFLYKFFLLFLLSVNSYGNIIYDKDNLLVTSYELEDFIQIYNNNGIEILSENDALKKYIFIKRILNKLREKNPELIKNIDIEINKKFGDLTNIDLNHLDILRYQNLFSIYKKEYFENEFLKSDLKNIFLRMNRLELPLSTNNCNTIEKIKDFKNNDQFVEIFFKNIKENSNFYKIELDNTTYTICMNNKIFRELEKIIVVYLDKKIDLKLKKYIYKN